MTGLEMRVVRSDGVVLVDDRIDDAASAEMAGSAAGERTTAALEDGYGLVLEYRDPDGIIAPSDQWVQVIMMPTP